MRLRNGQFHTKRWAGYFLVLGGVGMLAGGIWFVHEAARFLDSTARAEGTVIELRRERGAKGIAQDHPVVRFRPSPSVAPREFRSRFGMWPSPFSVGDKVTVAYEPLAPERAEIDSFWTLWFVPGLMVLFGVACGLAGISTLRRAPPPPGRGCDGGNSR